MSKAFFTSGTGQQQTITPAQNEKVIIYNDITDAENDLANLDEGQIVATKDVTIQDNTPVDVIQSGNMNPVTSNAVANSNAMPVDTVTSGDMHSVTSNAVASLIKKEVHTNVTSNELGFVDLGLYATQHILLSAYSGSAWVTAIVTDYDKFLALITDYQDNVLPNTTLDSITIVYI